MFRLLGLRFLSLLIFLSIDLLFLLLISLEEFLVLRIPRSTLDMVGHWHVLEWVFTHRSEVLGDIVKQSLLVAEVKIVLEAVGELEFIWVLIDVNIPTDLGMSLHSLSVVAEVLRDGA